MRNAVCTVGGHDTRELRVGSPGKGEPTVWVYCARCGEAVKKSELDRLEDSYALWVELQGVAKEVSDNVARYGLSAILWLEDAGLLEPTYRDDLLEPEWEIFV